MDREGWQPHVLGSTQSPQQTLPTDQCGGDAPSFLLLEMSQDSLTEQV